MLRWHKNKGDSQGTLPGTKGHLQGTQKDRVNITRENKVDGNIYFPIWIDMIVILFISVD
jgi:hypothetical protein